MPSKLDVFGQKIFINIVGLFATEIISWFKCSAAQDKKWCIPQLVIIGSMISCHYTQSRGDWYSGLVCIQASLIFQSLHSCFFLTISHSTRISTFSSGDSILQLYCLTHSWVRCFLRFAFTLSKGAFRLC